MKTLEQQIADAKSLKRRTYLTMIVWEVYCDGLDTSAIDVMRTQREAIQVCKNMKKEEGIDLYYRPVVIDDDSGVKVDGRNIHLYLNTSPFVKKLKKEMMMI